MLTTYLVLLALILLFSAIFSAAETSYTSLTAVQVEKLRTQDSRFAKLAANLWQDSELLIGSILVGNNIANTVAGALATILTIEYWGQPMVAYSTAILTLIILIFAEVTPKQIALQHNEFFAVLLAPLLRFFMIILAPIVKLVSLFGMLFNKLLGGKKPKPFSLDTILHMVNLAEASGAVQQYEKDAVKGLFRLGDHTVQSILTHRKEVFSLDASISIAEALPLVANASYTRVPVYGTRGSEEIIGIVLENLLIKAYIDGLGDQSLHSIMVEPIYVPASLPLKELLNVFSRESLNIAIVLDEYGGLAGVASREDVVEEILGELYDEDESPELVMERVGEALRFSGDFPIYRLEEVVGEKIPHDKHIFTVAGLIGEKLERIAEENDEVLLDVGKFLVEQVLEKRVISVRFYPNTVEEKILHLEELPPS
ncbi:hemolysin family protein [Entomospira nematocerorum]|uniref:HlyC/CorC family transporter n=1 Tax=Entomospira nematocerorum TaxID=2719987 RepID=A0A968GBD7_9SPIO|nr:hemolysin family protein [Entomospira nematocera]NIZ46745.1 HlyC/CorC family transporter [Entomospira nematocera]WDI33459.1 hemolysin family protein [Entomospira nematocera]